MKAFSAHSHISIPTSYLKMSFIWVDPCAHVESNWPKWGFASAAGQDLVIYLLSWSKPCLLYSVHDSSCKQASTIQVSSTDFSFSLSYVNCHTHTFILRKPSCLISGIWCRSKSAGQCFMVALPGMPQKWCRHALNVHKNWGLNWIEPNAFWIRY